MRALREMVWTASERGRALGEALLLTNRLLRERVGRPNEARGDFNETLTTS